MRKNQSILLVLFFISTLLSAQSTRNNSDFFQQAMKSFDLTNIDPSYIEGEKMGDSYRFYPAYQGAELIGYIWWTRDVIVANHSEDLILLIKNENGSATLEDFWIGYNEYHEDLEDEAKRDKINGMQHDSDFEEADIITGSTISSYQVMATGKTTLFIFQRYVIDKGLI